MFINCEVLRTVLACVAPAVHKEHPPLSHVLYKEEPTHITLTATNGYMIADILVRLRVGTSNPAPAIWVDPKTLKTALALFHRDHELVTTVELGLFGLTSHSTRTKVSIEISKASDKEIKGLFVPLNAFGTDRYVARLLDPHIIFGAKLWEQVYTCFKPLGPACATVRMGTPTSPLRFEASTTVGTKLATAEIELTVLAMPMRS